MIHVLCLNQKEEHLWSLMSEGVFKFKSNILYLSPVGNLKGGMEVACQAAHVPDC